MSETPRTDALIAELDANHEVAIPFVWRQMVNLARQLESALAAMTAQRDSIHSGLHALFNAANLFTKYSMDGGQTWQAYPIERRIALAIAVCKDDVEWEERALAAEARALAMEKDAGRWKEKARLQRRELRRLNKVLGPYWTGFRKGLGMEADGKLRLTMIQAFGSEKVRAAEHAAIDASRARA